MRDSNPDTAIHDEPAATVQGTVSAAAAATAAAAAAASGTPAPANMVGGAVAPKSSPPLGSEPVHDDLALAHAPCLVPNGTVSNHHPDLDDNESEAETLISSPVKKREAMKRATELTQQHQRDSTRRQPSKGPADSANNNDRLDFAQAVKQTGAVETPQATDREKTVRDTGAADDNNESDNLSEVSSTHLSSAASDSDSSSRSADSESDDNRAERRKRHSESEEVGTDRDDGTANPRKRKHRDSYKQTSMEPPRRRRRASDEGRAHNGDNADPSSPQLRRHRRTTSAQSIWDETNPNKSRNAPASASGRQRRAATHFPVREAKILRNNWDSDTSSEASHQHQQGRLNRNINRSVSTPGRPMARDHKRHVNKYGFTRLAEACENGDLDAVKEWRQKDPEQLEQREFAGNTPLQVASLNGFPEIVSYLLEQDCNPHTANTDQDTPLIDAVENGHIDVVRLLLQAGVDPLRQNLKGQQALDVVTEDTDHAQDIRAALRQAIDDWKNNGRGEKQQMEGEPSNRRPGPSKELHFLAYTSDNLLRLASENDRTGIVELLQSQVEVNNDIVAAAAKTGDTFTVSMLLAEMKPREAKKRPEKPLLAVIGTSHFEMVKYLTGADGFNPTWRSRSNGMTWYELAEHRQGPNWKQEKDLLKQLYDERSTIQRQSSSPISKRESGKRRRSSPRSRGLDVDMDDMDAFEQARSRRRLVSKKVMRETSNRRRSFSSDSDDGPIRSATSKDNSPETIRVKPAPAVKKVGRPRKTSASSELPRSQLKRRRSSLPHDHGSAFDTSHTPRPHSIVNEDENPQGEKKIKIEESERQQAEAEAEAEAEARRKTIELEAKAKAEKLAEEQRKAEEAKKEEETLKEAVRKAEEIRLQHQRRMAEERRVQEEKQLKTFPSALRHALTLTASLEKQQYIQHHFLPVQVVKRADLNHIGEAENDADELWMLNYHAAAILNRSEAASLLDLPSEPTGKRSQLTDIATFEMSEEQRRAMLLCLQLGTLVHTLPVDEESIPEDDIVAELAIAEKTRHRIAEDRSRFLAMKPLRWIRFRDFQDFVASAENLPHLSNLEIVLRFDCCLDQTPFLAGVTSEASRLAPNGTTSTEGSDNSKVSGTGSQQ